MFWMPKNVFQINSCANTIRIHTDQAKMKTQAVELIVDAKD